MARMPKEFRDGVGISEPVLTPGWPGPRQHGQEGARHPARGRAQGSVAVGAAAFHVLAKVSRWGEARGRGPGREEPGGYRGGLGDVAHSRCDCSQDMPSCDTPSSSPWLFIARNLDTSTPGEEERGRLLSKAASVLSMQRG